jgi:hypothetical protein
MSYYEESRIHGVNGGQRITDHVVVLNYITLLSTCTHLSEKQRYVLYIMAFTLRPEIQIRCDHQQKQERRKQEAFGRQQADVRRLIQAHTLRGETVVPLASLLP